VTKCFGFLSNYFITYFKRFKKRFHGKKVQNAFSLEKNEKNVAIVVSVSINYLRIDKLSI